MAKLPHEVVHYKILPFAVESAKKVARSRLNLFNADSDFFFRIGVRVPNAVYT